MDISIEWASRSSMQKAAVITPAVVAAAMLVALSILFVVGRNSIPLTASLASTSAFLTASSLLCLIVCRKQEKALTSQELLKKYDNEKEDLDVVAKETSAPKLKLKEYLAGEEKFSMTPKEGFKPLILTNGEDQKPIYVSDEKTSSSDLSSYERLFAHCEYLKTQKEEGFADQISASFEISLVIESLKLVDFLACKNRPEEENFSMIFSNLDKTLTLFSILDFLNVSLKEVYWPLFTAFIKHIQAKLPGKEKNAQNKSYLSPLESQKCILYIIQTYEKNSELLEELFYYLILHLYCEFNSDKYFKPKLNFDGKQISLAIEKLALKPPTLLSHMKLLNTLSLFDIGTVTWDNLFTTLVKHGLNFSNCAFYFDAHKEFFVFNTNYPPLVKGGPFKIVIFDQLRKPAEFFQNLFDKCLNVNPTTSFILYKGKVDEKISNLDKSICPYVLSENLTSKDLLQITGEEMGETFTLFQKALANFC